MRWIAKGRWLDPHVVLLTLDEEAESSTWGGNEDRQHFLLRELVTLNVLLVVIDSVRALYVWIKWRKVRAHHINLCTLPGSDAHSKGRLTNIQRVTPFITSKHTYSQIALHFDTNAGERCSRQKRYGNMKYRNSSKGLGTIVAAVHTTRPRTNNVD